MKTKFILFLILGIDAAILFYEANFLSISPSEALIVYGDSSFLQFITLIFIRIFPIADIGLRFFMIILHLMSALLLFFISKDYIKQDRNRLWLVVLFLLLPGTISSALIVSHASIIIFGLFLYIYLQKRDELLSHFLALVYLFIEAGFSYMFLGLGLYYFYNKQWKELLFYITLYILSLYMYGFVAHGIPSGHFLDLLGVYSAIFSPILFIYLVYTLYREFLSKNLTKIWFIASTAFLISVVLSFRQRINLEYFAPYLMVLLPLAVQLFISSYRVRLKQHRKKYKLAFIFTAVFLFVNAFVVFFHKELYLFLTNPKRNFSYNVDIAKPLAIELKRRNIFCVQVKKNKDMQRQLHFYGIQKCNDNLLEETSLDSKKANVTISYKNKTLYKANVTKLNKSEMKFKMKEKAFSDIK